MSNLFSSPSKQAQAAAQAQGQISQQAIQQIEDYTSNQQGQLRSAIGGLGPNPFVSASPSTANYAVDPANKQSFSAPTLTPGITPGTVSAPAPNRPPQITPPPATPPPPKPPATPPPPQPPPPGTWSPTGGTPGSVGGPPPPGYTPAPPGTHDPSVPGGAAVTSDQPGVGSNPVMIGSDGQPWSVVNGTWQHVAGGAVPPGAKYGTVVQDGPAPAPNGNPFAPRTARDPRTGRVQP